MPDPITTGTGSGDQGDDNNQGGTGDSGSQDNNLGDGGRRAIEAERNSRRQAERRTRELEAELTKLREGSMSDQEKAVERAKREALAEASTAFHTRIRQAEVRAAAAGKLADPEDAIRFLDLDDVAVDDNGNVDKKAVTKMLDELVKAKPYLAASATRPTGDADQGARSTAGNGSTMNDLIRQAIRR